MYDCRLLRGPEFNGNFENRETIEKQLRDQRGNIEAIATTERQYRGNFENRGTIERQCREQRGNREAISRTERTTAPEFLSFFLLWSHQDLSAWAVLSIHMKTNLHVVL
jgi:hypothetical protein